MKGLSVFSPMPRVALVASNHDKDPGSVANGTTEHAETKAAVFAAEKILKANGVEVYVPPTNLLLPEKIAWINEYFTEDDFLIEIHLSAAESSDTSGVSVWYETGKEQEKTVAEYFSSAIALRLRMQNKGANEDSKSRHGQWGILRETRPHAWMFEMGFITRFEDIEKFRDFGVQAIVDSVTDLFLPDNPLLKEEDCWSFRDVPPSHFAAEAIQKAKKRGLIAGDSVQNFRPNSGMSRGELLVLLDRLGMLSSNDDAL